MKVNEKAMLVKLSITQWSSSITDKSATEDLSNSKGASNKSVAVRKQIIAREDLEAIRKAVNETQVYHRKVTLPWSDLGYQMLPSAMFVEYSANMRQQEIKIQTAVNGFLTNYTFAIDTARQALGGLFNATDYPAADEIREKYTFKVDFRPIPTADDFRLDLSAEDVNDIKAAMVESINRDIADSLSSVWARVHDTVSKIANTLSNETAVFRDSLIRNVQDLVAIMPNLNIANDPDLEAVRKELEQSICGLNPQTLRDDKNARANAAKNAMDIMAGYMG